MQALNIYVIIEKIKEQPKKIAGLELTEIQNKDLRYLRAEVISVGDQVPENVLKPGQIVRYDRHAGHEIESENEGKQWLLLKVGDIVAVE